MSEDINDYKAWKEEEDRKKLYRNAKTWNKQGKPIVKKKRKVRAKKVKTQVNNYSKYQKVTNAVYVVSRKRNFDFLKYWSLVRHWAMVQFSWTQEELDTLLYLYSEPSFSRDQFNEFADVLMGKKNSLNSFIERGHIIEIERYDKTKGETVNTIKIYKLSFQTLKIISSIYDRLLLKTQISENRKVTKVFQVFKSTIKDRKIAKLITKMNEVAKSIKSNQDASYIKDDVKKNGMNI